MHFCFLETETDFLVCPPQGAFSLVIEAWYAPAADLPRGKKMWSACVPLDGDKLYGRNVVSSISHTQRAVKCMRHSQHPGFMFVWMPYVTRQFLTIKSLQHNCTSLVLFLACLGKCTGSSENTEPCQKSNDSPFLDFTPFLLGPS